MDKTGRLHGHKCLLILLLASEVGSVINVIVTGNQKKPSGAVVQLGFQCYCRAVTAPKILIHSLICYLINLKKKKGAIL